MLERVICLAIGYICGMFQTSYIYGRMHGIDIREHGSGNAGTTNALRTLGKKAGAITLLGDCCKCIVAVWLAKLIFGESCADIMPLLSLYAAAGCVLGHNFPAVLGFRGGKGIAASVGMLLAFDVRIFVICAIVFFSIFFTTHYVSLCSMMAYVTFVIALVVLGSMGVYPVTSACLMEMYIVAILLAALAIYRHKANIVRLLQGNENKTILSKKK